MPVFCAKAAGSRSKKPQKSSKDSATAASAASNAFSADYSYERGALPVCDSLSDRAALLTVMPVLTDRDVDDIIAAFRKVGNAFAPQTKAAE